MESSHHREGGHERMDSKKGGHERMDSKMGGHERMDSKMGGHERMDSNTETEKEKSVVEEALLLLITE